MKRTRWTANLVGGLLLGLAALGGCKQQIFIEPADYHDAVSAGPQARLKLLEEGPAQPIVPMTTVAAGATPGTVMDPSRPPRFVTLKELMAIGLEQGNRGAGGGQVNDQVGTGETDTITAFALDTARVGVDIEKALSKFDARWVSSLTWNKNDSPTLSLQQSFSNGDSATLSSSLVKPLPTGGVAGITFSTQYLNLSNPPPTNSGFVTLTTSYTPRVQFSFEQPLLQGFGVEINQLLAGHPGSQLLQFRSGPLQRGADGILITRIRTEQQRVLFDDVVNSMLLNVEEAYWNLYSAYFNLAAQEEGLKQALAGFVFFFNRALAGAARPQQAFQAAAQLELFWSQVITARNEVLRRERFLRGVLGMRSDDGTRLVPIDEPTLVPYVPDYAEAANDAVQNLPLLNYQRQELKVQQLNLIRSRNLRRPDLRFLTTYDVAGLGPRLDGTTVEDNAFRSLTSNRFNSWQIGFRLDMPIGFRDANADIRANQLTIRQKYLHILDAERKSQEFVIEQIRGVVANHEIIKHRRAQRAYLDIALDLDSKIRESGAAGRDPETAAAFIANLLQQQRDLANATAQEFQAIADYNIALARLEAAKGTIQRYNNVSIADGPLPPHVQKRAADHFRARDVALKVREHPADTVAPCVPPEWQPLTDGAIGAKAAEVNGYLRKPDTAVPPQPQPWLPGQVIPPLPPPPAETAPTPGRPIQPPLGAALPAMPKADTAATFTPVDTLRLPKRNTGPVAAETPPSSTPLPAPIPLAPPTGTGVPIGVAPPPR